MSMCSRVNGENLAREGFGTTPVLQEIPFFVKKVLGGPAVLSKYIPAGIFNLEKSSHLNEKIPHSVLH